MHGQQNIKIFSTHFRQNTQISSFMKTHPVGAEVLRADGRADRRMENRYDDANSLFDIL